MDVDANGGLDYLLYDTSGKVASGGGAGDLLVFMNDGKGGFGSPQRINVDAGGGSDYTTRPHFKPFVDPNGNLVDGLEAKVLDANAELAAILAGQEVCKKLGTVLPTDPLNAVYLAACVAVGTLVTPGPQPSLHNTANEVADLAAPLLSTSPDAVPADGFRPGELRALGIALTASLAFGPCVG